MRGRSTPLLVTLVVGAALLWTTWTPSVYAQGEALTTTETDHFSFVYRQRYSSYVNPTIAIAERTRVQIMNDLGAVGDQPRVEVRFARNIDELRTLCPRQPPSWADAVAFWPDNIIVISLTTTQHRPVTLETVFRHELSHLVLRWVVGDAQIPRWFNEGLAIVESDEQTFERLRLLWPSVARGEITPLRRLERRFPAREFQANQAYAESADFVRFLARYRGRWRFREMLERIRDGEPFFDAMSATWGSSIPTLESAWHRDLRQRYSVFPTVTAGMTMWIGVGMLAIFAYIKRRRDIRRRIDEMPDVRDDEEDEEREP